MQVTILPAPDPQVEVTFQVDELGISETQTTVAGVAEFSIPAVTARNNTIWDATLQVGANMRAAAAVQAVETNGATSIGVTVNSNEVTYCAPTGGGGGGEATSLTGPVLFSAKNNTGVTITKGSVVYIDGVSGNTPTVALADADDAAKMPAFGLAYADLADAETGSIITFGDITNVDTDAFILDNPLYVSTTPGVLTQTKPAGETSLIQNIGLVTRDHQSVGRIKVTGAGRSNDTPNLDDGNIFVGNASNQVTTTALSTLTGVTSLAAGAVIAVDQATGAVTVSHGAKAATGTALPWPSSITIDAYGHVVASGISQVPLEASSNLSDVANASTARDNLGLTIGTTTGDIVALDASSEVPLALLPALAAAYTGQIETIDDKTYTIDPSVVAGRTITSFYARSGAGTCTATLKNAALTVGVVSVTTSSTTATISNTTVAVDSALTIVVTSNVAATDVVFSVEFTQ